MKKNEGIKVLAASIVSIVILKRLSELKGSGNEEDSVYTGRGGIPKYSSSQEKNINEIIGDTWGQTYEQMKAKVAGWVPYLDPHKVYIVSAKPIKNFYNMDKITEYSSKGSPKPVFRSSKQEYKEIETAPLWFASGSEWVDWMINEMPHWMYGTNYIYEIDLNLEQVKKIDRSFINKYKIDTGFWGGVNFDWVSIIQDYKGVYTDSPYELGVWDISSGCVWNWDAVNKIMLVAQKPGSDPAPPFVGFGGSFNAV